MKKKEEQERRKPVITEEKILKKDMKNKIMKVLLFGMSITMAVPEADMAMAEVVEETNVSEETESTYRNSLPVMSVLITEEEFADASSRLKELIEKEIAAPDTDRTDASSFLRYLLMEFEDSMENQEKIVELFIDIYEEEVLVGVREFYMRKVNDLSTQGIDIGDTLSQMEAAETIGDITLLYDFLNALVVTEEPLIPTSEETIEESVEETEVNLDEMENGTSEDENTTDPEMTDINLEKEKTKAIEELNGYEYADLEGTYKEKADTLKNEALSNLTNASSVEVMQTMISDYKEQIESMKTEQKLEKSKEIAKDGLKKHMDSLTFSMPCLFELAVFTYDQYCEKIKNATTETDVTAYFDQGVIELNDIFSEAAHVVNKFIEDSLQEVENKKMEISNCSESMDRIFLLCKEKMQSSKSVNDVFAFQTIAIEIMELLQNVSLGEWEKSMDVVDKLKNITSDEETIKLLGAINDEAKNTDSSSFSSMEAEELLEEATFAFDTLDTAFYKERLIQKLTGQVELLEPGKKSIAEDILSQAKKEMETLDKSLAYQIYKNTMKEMESIVPVDDLLEIKEQAKQELKNVTSLSYESIKKVLEAYEKKVDQAESKEDIQKVVEEGKALLIKLEKGEMSKNLKEKKEAALIKLKTFSSMENEEVMILIESYADQIELAVSVEEIDRLLSEAENTIREANDKISEELHRAKEDALTELKELLDSESDADLIVKLMEIYNRAEESLKDLTEIAEIEDILEAEKSSMEKVIFLYKEESSLSDAKKQVSEQIDGLISRIDHAELQEILKKFGESAKTEIETAENEEELQEILEHFKSEIKEATAEYAENKTLTITKTNMIEKLESLKNGKILSMECQNILLSAKEDIMDAKDTEDVMDIYEKAAEEFETTYLTELRNTYLSKLEEMKVSALLYDDNTVRNISTIIEKAKTNISNATNEQVMKNVIQQTSKNVNSLISAYENTQAENDSLINSKEDAIFELQSAINFYSSSTQKIISAYTNKINQASSETQVKEYLAEGLSILSKLEQSEGVQENTDAPLGHGSSVNDILEDETIIHESLEEETDSALIKETEKRTDAVKTGDENALKIISYGIGALGGFIAFLIGILKRRKKKV